MNQRFKFAKVNVRTHKSYLKRGCFPILVEGRRFSSADTQPGLVLEVLGDVVQEEGPCLLSVLECMLTCGVQARWSFHPPVTLIWFLKFLKMHEVSVKFHGPESRGSTGRKQAEHGSLSSKHHVCVCLSVCVGGWWVLNKVRRWLC